MNQGIALLNLARIDPAKVLLEAAAKKSPNDPHAWFSLGLLYKNSDNPQGSVDAFRHVTEIDPNDADSWYFLGAALAQLKQYPQAIDAFQHALKLNPLHASANSESRAPTSSLATRPRPANTWCASSTSRKTNWARPSVWLTETRENIRWWKKRSAAAEKALPPIPVTFVPVTESAGLMSKASSRSRERPGVVSRAGCVFPRL